MSKLVDRNGDRFGLPWLAFCADGSLKFVFGNIALDCPKRFGAGAYVVSLCRVSAVNDGSRGQAAPTNRNVTLALAEIVRLEGGLEREIFRFADGAALDAQLGTVPAPAASGSKP